MSETNKTYYFSINQYYSITPDESQIDCELEHWTHTDEQSKQEDTAFFHRLFQGITNNKTAMQQCMVYLMLVEQDAASGDGTYVGDFYKERVQDFLDILFTLARRPQDCPFTPEDSKQIIQAMKNAKTSTDPDAREGASNFFEPLESALRAKITPAGFEIKQIVSHCAECGAEQ